MTTGRTSFPNRRAAAERNRDRILAAARDAFADPGAEISMAEIARRAGVGMATLYRNFPGRQELLEALYADEVDTICGAARAEEGQAPGDAPKGTQSAVLPKRKLGKTGVEVSALVVDIDAAELTRMLHVNIVGTALGLKHAFQRC